MSGHIPCVLGTVDVMVGQPRFWLEKEEEGGRVVDV